MLVLAVCLVRVNNPMLKERTHDVISGLLSESPLLPPDLLKQSNLLTLARIKSLTLTERGGDLAEKSFNDRLAIFSDIDAMTSAEGENYPVAVHDLIAHQAHDLIKESGKTASVKELGVLDSLAGKASMVVDTCCLITHQNDNSLFNITTTKRMSQFVDFIKTNQASNKLSLIDYGLASIYKQEDNILKSDADSIAVSFVNLASDMTYTSLLDKSENNPDVAAVMFNAFGKPFADSFYSHTKASKNDKHAVSLLTNKKHGWLVGSGDPSGSSYIKTLMSIVSKSDDSEQHLDRIISLSDNTESTTSMIETLIEAHNNTYDTSNIATLISKVGGRLSNEQINRLSNLLLKSSDTQPVLSSLQVITDLNKSKGYDTEHLEVSMQAIKDRMANDFSVLDKPVSQYSTTTIDFTGVNTSVFIADAHSTPHLQKMIDDKLADYKGEVRFTINSSDSSLDESVKAALEKYLFKDDSYDLNKIITTPIMETERQSTAEWNQLLFEASKQQKTLPSNASDNIRTLSKVVEKDRVLLIKSFDSATNSTLPLSKLRTSNDILDIIDSKNVSGFTLEATGLGKSFDKALLGAMNNVLNEPDSKKYLNDLDDLLGLPIENLSTNIEINPSTDEKKGKINNIVSTITKNLLTTNKVTDAKSNSSTRTPD